MAWFARSLANSLKLDEDDDDGGGDKEIPIAGGSSESSPHKQQEDDQSHGGTDSPSEIASRGVKEDLSEISKTLTRQFWGVASFLAPPPPSSPRISGAPDPDASNPAGIDGIRSDFAEIGGRFRTGISKLSSNKAVSEITKIASSLLQLGSEEQGSVEEYAALGVVGMTDEVVSFVRNIAVHPATWLDFPLPENDDSDVLDMSDVQQEHALAVERLAPRLANLRIELCPEYMSEGRFWKIYFVLVYAKLNKHDAELLSTPEIVEARAMLQQELRNRVVAKPEEEWSRRTSHPIEPTDSANVEHLSVPANAQFESVPPKTSELEPAISTVAADYVMEKHPIPNTESQMIDKSVVQAEPTNEAKLKKSLSGPSSKVLDEKYEDDGDDWLKEEDVGDVSASNKGVGTSGITMPIEDEEDVSFSDLEDDDADMPASNRKTTHGSDSSTKESRDWVQLSRNSAQSATKNNPVSAKVPGSEEASASKSEAKESSDWLDVEDITVE